MSTGATPSPPTGTTTSALLAPPNHSRSLWCSCLGSALRTSLACVLVGCTTLYAPASVRGQVTFPAFSYVTAVLIVGEATLGDALRGAVHAAYGTVLGVLPAALVLYLVGPVEFSVAATAMAVGLSAFVLALPESTSLLTKRLALGQTVLAYAAGHKRNGRDSAIFHPAHVAASTTVGVAAAVLALLFPFPRLACYEIRVKSKLYSEMGMERLRLLVDAFCADNSGHATASISQAKSLTAASSRLLQNIKLKQVSLQWERSPFKILPQRCRVTPNRLQAIETPLKGLELALNSINSFPCKILEQDLKDHVHSLSDLIVSTLRQDNKLPKSEVIVNQTLHPMTITAQDTQDLPPYFFLFCMRLFHQGGPITQSPNVAREKKVTPTTEHTENSCIEVPSSTRRIKRTWALPLGTERLVVALKCSLSLGFAILFGLLFSKNNGFWSGLIVAVSMTPRREATFKLANVRAQGTALGSVYGVLASAISQKLMEVRPLALLPWIVFTCFLRYSRMYGQAGAVAAVISAILILGRRHYGSPVAFAIARLTETFIGLSCSIFVELLLRPTRASTLARTSLLRSLQTLNDCMEALVLQPHSSIPSQLREKEKKLTYQVNELQKFTGEAEVEPNFWFLPFPTGCYHKLHGSLSKMAELVRFLGYAMDLLVQESHELGATWSEVQVVINGDLEHLRKLIGFSLHCFEEVIRVKSLSRLERELQRRNTSDDLELGKSPNTNGCGALTAGEEESEKVVSSLLEHTRDIILGRIDDDMDGEMKSQVGLYLASIGFCMVGLMRETKNLEKGILELVQWENPARHIDLYEMSCKIKEISA